jgi:hypothetical protein
MATLYNKIYTRAISEINDPFITASYNANPINYFKTMYNYLLNAIPLYNSPNTIIPILSNRVDPDGEIESFIGDGINPYFVLSTTPNDSSYFSYNINDVYVSGSFDYTTNTATLASTPYIAGEVLIEWYSDGYFNSTLTEAQENILACYLVSCWGEKEKNFLLDIRRLLNDDSFSMSAESTTIRNKDNWYYSMREKAEKLMNQESWLVYQSTMKTRYGLS